ncbi:uncharacterized protein LOC142795442 [Rhipicephalus microplus]|uniref:uncharacterized protein LOC142774388 n=1 Tax=Rhipicephalus microplus TaxID=6941 RepID=UPI003F6C296D
MSHRTSSSKPGEVLCLEIGSDDDEFLGEGKSSPTSAKFTALRLRSALPSAVGGLLSVTVPSEASPSSQLRDTASTTASSRQQQTDRGGTKANEREDLRNKLNRIRCRRRGAQKRPAARSDDDDFLGEAKSSAASAKPTAPHYRAASSNALSQVPSVCASSEPPTSSQWEQQTGECGTDETECEDLRDKLNRIRGRLPLKPNRRDRPSNADLRARWRGVADEGLSSFVRRRATFLCDGRAGKARRRNASFRNARRLRTYVDLNRPQRNSGILYLWIPRSPLLATLVSCWERYVGSGRASRATGGLCRTVDLVVEASSVRRH